ncbi:MAG TPA: kelch repeat-containing protein [Xanthobacteraceae bacterium]|nr:kelch repeat-containing protein [Xanthobacteraceae bacterium]
MKSALRRGLMVAALAAPLMLAFGGIALAQKWSTLAPFPEASEELYGIAAGGKLHVFGGLAPGWKPKGLVYEYDLAKNAWTKKKAMPLPSHHLALAALNGKIYVFGGFKLPESGPPAWVPIDNVWEYDPAADSWKALAPLPTKRGSANALVVDGKIYVIGGASVHPGSKETAVHPARPHRSVGANEMYDPATNTWVAKSPMPTARNHAAAGVVNNKIYIIAGRIGSAFITRASNVDLVEEYDPASDQWGSLKAPMPGGPRSATGWGTFNGRILVAGGETRSREMNATWRRVEAYDAASNRWDALPSMQFHRHGFAADVVDGKFIVVSGDVQSGGGPGAHVETDSVEMLDLTALK